MRAIPENAPDLRKPATYSGATSIYSSTTTQVNALKMLRWMIAELLYRRLLSSSGETQSSVVLAML
jgi:hypothetical protein